MDFVIEDGYNTSYMSVLFMLLFFDKSMIERYMLLENNSDNFDGILLQKIILNNFVKPIRNNMCVTSKMMNEIRLCAIMSGWKKSDNIFETFGNADPIDFLCFILNEIKFSPIDIASQQSAWNTKPDSNIFTKIMDKFLISAIAKSNIQETYNIWSRKHKILNIPVFVIFKIDNLKSSFNINKRISLFDKTHQYHDIKWIFHGLFCKNKNDKNKNDYSIILNKDSKLVSFNQNVFPNVNMYGVDSLQNMAGNTVYIMYRKEPSI